MNTPIRNLQGGHSCQRPDEPTMFSVDGRGPGQEAQTITHKTTTVCMKRKTAQVYTLLLYPSIVV